MKNVYLAAPLFSDAECDFNCKLRDELEGLGMSVFLPQEHSNDINDQRDARQAGIFSKNVTNINETDMVVAVLDGVDVDSGTAWEIGYAYARGLPVYGLRTDFRTMGIEGTVNLMIERSVVMCMGMGELVERLKKDVL
jgi:nucleoside 2-deoxyribosyltransferase